MLAVGPGFVTVVGGLITRVKSTYASPATSNARKKRPIQRRRSFDGSRAKPTGVVYSSCGRVTTRCYRRARTTTSIPRMCLRLNRYALARAATQFAPIIFRHSAPDAGVLTGFERPLEAILLHRARATDRLCSLDLCERRTGGADGEEDLWIDVSTGSALAPVHR